MKVLYGWENVSVEIREVVIMKKMSRSNAECRQILRNGKPPDLRNKSLLMPLSILSKTVSHGVVKGGGQDF